MRVRESLLTAASDALICIKSSHSTENDQAVSDPGRIDNAHSAEAWLLDGKSGGPRRIAWPLRERHLAQNVIAQHQAGSHQRVGG